jgi:hypothetical protein
MSACSKIPYRNLRIAQMALRAIARRCATRGTKSPTGAYICHSCHCWHLTSRSGTQIPPWVKARSHR